MRRYDRGIFCCCGKDKKTKTKTILKYVQLYSGPEYWIYFKASFLIKIISFAFMYGSLFPIVVPICFFALLNLYITEKLFLAYFYRKPPTYDASIISMILRILAFAPCNGLIIWYFILGNGSMFTNKLNLANEFNVSPPNHNFNPLKAYLP